VPTRLFPSISPSSIMVYQLNKKVKGDSHFDENGESLISICPAPGPAASAVAPAGPTYAGCRAGANRAPSRNSVLLARHFLGPSSGSYRMARRRRLLHQPARRRLAPMPVHTGAISGSWARSPDAGPVPRPAAAGWPGLQPGGTGCATGQSGAWPGRPATSSCC
jgi:hypothetical protein